MEALRKAEEAKRQAAQKEKDEPDSAAPAPVAEVLPVEDPVALEALWDATSTATVEAPQDDYSDLSESAPDQQHTPSLDVPFDFHIDEAFGALDLAPAPASAMVLEPVASDLSEASVSELEALDPEIDYLKPEDLRQFKPAAEASLLVETAPAAAFTLTLEEEPERPEAPRAAFISDPEPSEEPRKSVQVSAPEPAPVAVPSSQPEPEVATLRASRVDETQKAEPLSAIPERPRFKVPGLKTSDENRKRESARAVFNAKSGQEPKGRNTRRLLAVAAVLVLVPLAGGGFMLVQELGLLGGGTQYNIPEASYDAAREFPVVEEQPLAPAADVLLADVTQPLAPEPPVSADPAAVAIVSGADAALASPVAENPSPLAIETPVDVLAEASVVAEALLPVVAQALVEEAIVAAADTVTPSTETAVAEPPAVVEPSAPEAEVASDQAPAPATATPPPAPINITRSNFQPQVNAQLTQAYSAFRDGDYYAARALYQKALLDLPNNRDALLGLAAAAVELGDVTGARTSYSKLLELDPRDVLARVGLMDSMPLGDPIETESQLQRLKSEHPEVAQLSFALGNFYASQRRWNEAQAAYYDALLAAKAQSGSTVSPDFAFNLAVSLDRLNQPEPAYNFYREALEQSRTVNPGFDLRILRDRLDSLERQLP